MPAGESFYDQNLSATAKCSAADKLQPIFKGSKAEEASETEKRLLELDSPQSSDASSTNSRSKSDGKLNINLIFTTSIVCLGSSFVFGYNIGVLNQIAGHIANFYNETYTNRTGEQVSDSTVTTLWSLTTALLIPGAVIGSFLSGWLADFIGRKWTIVVAQAFTITGAILSCICVAAKAPELLMIGRLLFGFSSGFATTVTPMILSEIAPSKFRGAFGTVHQLSCTIGIFMSSIFGLHHILGTAEQWQYVLLLEIVPAVLTAAILPFIPDTPRFLMLVRHDTEAARKAMEYYRKSKNVQSEMAEMEAEGKGKTTTELVANAKTGASSDIESSAAAAADNEDKSYTLLQLLRDTDLRKPLAIACTLVIAQQFSGINAVFFYSSSIFQNAGIPVDYIPYAVILTNAVNVLMTVIAVPLMDKAGRRILLIVPMIIMAVDLVLMTVCLVFQKSVPTLGYVCVACIVIYVICFAVGLGPIPMFIGSEMFRQGPRSMVMTVVGVILWLATFVIAMVFEHLQRLAQNYTFIVFIVLLSGFVVFVIKFVPETKNKTFEEIAQQYGKKKPADSQQKQEMKTLV